VSSHTQSSMVRHLAVIEAWRALPPGPAKLDHAVAIISALIDFLEELPSPTNHQRDCISKSIEALRRDPDYPGAGAMLLAACLSTQTLRSAPTFKDLRVQLWSM
jgi:hypothetical protein